METKEREVDTENIPEMLRAIADRIDSGEFRPISGVLFWTEKLDGDTESVSHNTMGRPINVTTLIGVLERAKTTIHLTAIQRVSSVDGEGRSRSWERR